MVINVKRLKEVGITVRIFERNGKGDAVPVTDVHDPFIEVFVENGTHLPEPVMEAIRNMLPLEYGDPVLENLHNRIHMIQVMEAINNTGHRR